MTLAWRRSCFTSAVGVMGQSDHFILHHVCNCNSEPKCSKPDGLCVVIVLSVTVVRLQLHKADGQFTRPRNLYLKIDPGNIERGKYYHFTAA